MYIAQLQHQDLGLKGGQEAESDDRVFTENLNWLFPFVPRGRPHLARPRVTDQQAHLVQKDDFDLGKL